MAIIITVVLVSLIATFLFSPNLSLADLSEYAYETLELPDGIKINYRTQGNQAGSKILLIHGGTDSLDVWDTWASILGQDYCIVTPDLPGHGLSDSWPEGNYRPEKFAEFIQDFTDALGMDDFIIGGHSYGGDSVLRFCVNYPSQARAMILVSPGGYKPNGAMRMNPLVLKMLTGSWGNFIRTHIGTRFLLGKFFHRFFFCHVTPATEANIDRQVRFWRYEKNRGAGLKLILNCETDYTEVSGTESITIPTLLIWGREDQISPLQVGERLAREIPYAKLKIYDDMGHMSHIELSQETAQEVLAFLRGLN